MLDVSQLVKECAGTFSSTNIKNRTTRSFFSVPIVSLDETLRFVSLHRTLDRIHSPAAVGLTYMPSTVH